MKKKQIGLLFILIIMLVVIVGCEKVDEVEGNYKEGTYFGSYTDDGDKPYSATAVIYVSEKGEIESVFIDATYLKDDIPTTKKTLGFDYGMKNTSSNIGNIPGGAEWHEQVNTLEEKIVSEQGLDWLVWLDENENTTDSVSNVTIKIDALYKAVNDAINKAK